MWLACPILALNSPVSRSVSPVVDLKSRPWAIPNLDLNEKWTLRFRAEAFNVLNHPNFNTPISGSVVFNTSDLTKYSGSAGAITETANRERQIQFALRLEF